MYFLQNGADFPLRFCASIASIVNIDENTGGWARSYKRKIQIFAKFRFSIDFFHVLIYYYEVKV